MKKALSLLLALILTLSLCTPVLAAPGDNEGDGEYKPFADVTDDKANSFLLNWTNYGIEQAPDGKRYFYFDLQGVEVSYDEEGNGYCRNQESMASLKAALEVYDSLGDSKTALAAHPVYDGEVRKDHEQSDLAEAATTVGNIIERFYRPMTTRAINNGWSEDGTVTNVADLTGPVAAVAEAKAFLNTYINIFKHESGKGQDIEPKKVGFVDMKTKPEEFKQAVNEIIEAYKEMSYDARMVLNELSLTDGNMPCLFEQRIRQFYDMANPPEMGNQDYSQLSEDAKEFFDEYFSYNSGLVVPQMKVNGTTLTTVYDGGGITKNVAAVRRALTAFEQTMTPAIEQELDELKVFIKGGPNGQVQTRFNDLMMTFGMWLNTESAQDLELREAGYTAPELNKDFTIAFPKTLQQGDDGDYTYTYENGILAVTVKKGSAERWRNAAMEMSQEQQDGIYFDLNFEKPQGSDLQGAEGTGNGYGGVWSQFVSGDVLLHNYNVIGNGQPMAAVNEQDGQINITPLERYSGNRMVVVWGTKDDAGHLNKDAKKFILKMVIKAEEGFKHQVEAPNRSLVDVENNVAVNVNTAAWTVEKELGVLTIRAAQGKTVAGNLTGDGAVAALTVSAPQAGYTLDSCSVTNGNGIGQDQNGKSACEFKVYGFYDNTSNEWCGRTTYYKLVWVNQNGTLIEETLTVKIAESTPKLSKLGEYGKENNVGKNSVQSVPVNAENVKAPADSGIRVEYKQGQAYFYTSFDGTNMPSVEDLQQGILIEPTGFSDVTKYKVREGSGSRDISAMAGNDVKEMVEAFRSTESQVLSSTDRRTIGLVACDSLKINNGKITVYFTATQQYRWKIVQWLNDKDEVVGYTYIYGQNGSFINTVNTPAVSSPADVTEENKGKPFVIGGEGMFFNCDQFPQEGKPYEKYFELSVVGNAQRDEDGYYHVYMPYEYFGITGGYEQAKKYDSAPVIRHYDHGYVWREDIKGEYTEYGVYFKTRDFSPFVVSCDPTSTETLQPDTPHYYYYTPATTAKDSPTTFDPGVALYLGLTLTSATGLAWLGRKKH